MGPVIAGVSTVSSTGAFMVAKWIQQSIVVEEEEVYLLVVWTRHISKFYGSILKYHTTGNGIDFGDLSEIKRQLAGASSSTRGVVIGGFKCSPA